VSVKQGTCWITGEKNVPVKEVKTVLGTKTISTKALESNTK